jgi:hypothetical protein
VVKEEQHVPEKECLVTQREVNRFNIGIHPGGAVVRVLIHNSLATVFVRAEDTGQAIA